MTPLVRIEAVAAPLLRDNVDTDAIIPSREMTSVSKTGLADGLFAGWRYRALGSRDPDPAFVLNDPRFRDARILIAGANFGCGSSREHAVWALAEYGFRVVIAPSFSPIFQGNCIRNGIAPIVLPAPAVAALAEQAGRGDLITVDLETMQVSADGASRPFQLDEEPRAMLMEGLDAIELTLKRKEQIVAFRDRDRARRPWIYFDAGAIAAPAGRRVTFLKCATHVVRDVAAATDRYVRWLDYAVVEEGAVPADLAAAWSAPASAGRRYAVLQPASGSRVFLRFVEGDEVAGYAPIRSYGWAAIEICVQDVEAVNTRMLRSQVFEVIGPPKPLDGFPTVKPMQVRGPDQETVYLTEIKVDDPASGLPTPGSLIDRPFIMVLACADLERTARWIADVLGLDVSPPVSIRYSMIQLSFGLPEDEKTPLSIVKGQGQTFLELDQYPAEARERPGHPGALPPGVAMTTMMYPDFARLASHWATPPAAREGVIYEGRRTGLLKTPEGALLEIVEGGPIA